MSNKTIFISCGFASLLTFPTVGHAQEVDESLFNRDRNISVSDRSRPEYDSLGLQQGAFIWRPQLDAYVITTDNVFFAENNTSSDEILTVNPLMEVESTWNRHSLSGSIGVTHQEYIENTEASSTGFDLGLDGRVDVTRALSILAGASADKVFERRSAFGPNNAAQQPIEQDIIAFYGGLKYETGRVRLASRAFHRDNDFEDALSIVGNNLVDQDFRDQSTTGVNARLDYAIKPDLSVFSFVEYDNVEHDNLPSTGITRDRNTVFGNVGTDFEIGLLRGQLAAGYFNTEFDSNSFTDVDGFNFSGDIEWFATPLITLFAGGERGTNASELLISPATTRTRANIGADYEYRRNIIISAGYNHTDDDYNFIDRTDKRDDIFLGGVILLNRKIGVEGRVSHRTLRSTGASQQDDFDELRFLLGLRSQF